jgi:hypothetical protein
MCCVVVVYLHSIQLTLISNLLPRPNQKSNKARDVAQWWSTCPVCEKPWFDPQYHKKKKKKNWQGCGTDGLSYIDYGHTSV